ncbi:MAG: MogA/MoaB family molybdenum cofactor biosynthesis protein [archaeon]
MVDFQSRDTRRGIEDVGLDDGDQPAEADDRTAGTIETDEESAPQHTGIVLLTVGASEGTDELPCDAVADVLEAHDWRIVYRERVEASFDAVQSVADRFISRRNVEAVVTVGGTGLSPSDVTVEAIEPLLEKRLPGFGELFRISYHERVGPNIVGMRPIAGISEDVPVFCLPGEQESAQFAASEILGETLVDIVAEAGE